MPMLEGKVDDVIGVDTHRDAHAAAILDRNGGLLVQLEVPSSQAGYEELLGVVAERAPGRRCWALAVAADARPHLKALLVTAPEPLRTVLRGGTWLRQARACAALTAQPSDPVEYRATVRALRATAERALAAHTEASQLGEELAILVRVVAPALLAQRGVGPVTGAQVLISWSHPGRLARRPPFPCWLVLPPSRRPPAGQSDREIRRCLKRTIARQLYRLLERTAAPGAGPGYEQARVARTVRR